jgi:nitroreductase
MDALETILNHRSIRKFRPDPISDEMLNTILEAASRASTTGNMQVYSIIVSRDQSIKEALLPLHFGQKMVTEAPVVLTFCADFNRFNLWCHQRDADPGYDNFLSFMTAAIDALLAAQNACIAAESFGLGICYLGTTTYLAEPIAKVLKLPLGVVPVTTVVLGWPDQEVPLTDRLPMRAVVHQEVYQNFSAEEIDEIYSERENSALTKRLLEENGLDNLAKVFVEKRYTKRDNVQFSGTLLNFLKHQQFFNQ